MIPAAQVWDAVKVSDDDVSCVVVALGPGLAHTVGINWLGHPCDGGEIFPLQE